MRRRARAASIPRTARRRGRLPRSAAVRGSARRAGSCPARPRHAARRDHRQRRRRRLRLGQGGDFRERGLDRAGTRLVRHGMQRRAALALVLHEPRDRHPVLRQAQRDVRQHARLVGHLDPEVERRAQVAARQALELPPARVILQEPRPGRADDRDHVGDHRGRRLEAARARAFERDLPNRVALQHHGVERPVDCSERMVPVDERRLDAHVELPVDERRGADESHRHLELARRADMILCDVLDAFELDVLERRPRAERDSCEDRHLRGGGGAVHVLRRVGLREAESLRLRERVGVLGALFHLREDEIRRAVDDAEDAVDVCRDEGLAQHLDHGNRRAHRRLEPKLHAALGGGGEELRSAACDELLVRRDDGLTGTQELEHVVAGRRDAAHQLGDERDGGVVADRRELVGQDAVVGDVLPLAFRIAHERAHDPKPVSSRALYVVGALCEQAGDGAADVAVAQQRDRDVNGRHAVSASPKRSCTARTARSTSAARTTHETRIDDVEMISMFTFASASASNMSAATPGWLFIPAPINETFAMSGSHVTPAAPMSPASSPRIRSATGTSSFGSVNEMSVCPAAETFCTIMSTLTPASARSRNTRAAMPGWSGTPRIVAFASDVSCAIPEMIARSSDSSWLTTRVPSASENDERTCSRMPWLRAYSTERSISTFAPPAERSSISSYVTVSSLRASGTIRGSAVYTPSTSV